MVIFILSNFTAYSNESSNTVIITGYYEKPESFDNLKTIKWESNSKGEFIEIIVKGKILNFEVVLLGWDNNDLVEKSQKFLIGEIENKTIILLTYMPEGIPSEKIKWKDLSGNDFEYIIQDYNMPDLDPKNHIFNIK